MIERADLKTIWLLGRPVEHSLSPLIQNRAIGHLKERAIYLAASVEPDDFEQVVRALPALGALGANVTVPHKIRAFEVCETTSERAQRIGAVNTLLFSDGSIRGDNTDGAGWWWSLPKEVHSLRRAVVIGAGGAARAVVATLIDNGFDEIVVLNRTVERAERLLTDLEAGFGTASLSSGTLASFPEHLETHTLVVQTTSVGLDGRGCPVDLPTQWPEGCYLSELIYGRSTPLFSRVRELGGEASDGLEMLCGQAALSLALWLGREPAEIPLELMRQAVQER